MVEVFVGVFPARIKDAVEVLSVVSVELQVKVKSLLFARISH